MNFLKLKRAVDRLELQRKVNLEEIKRLEDSLRKAKRHHKNALEARRILQDVAQAVQQRAHKRIAKVVTKCLAAVFPRPYSFHIVFEKKRGKTEARLEFRRGKLKLRPSDGVGGSVLDVAAFALRLACLGLCKPPRRKVVFVDEGFGGISNRQGNKRRLVTVLDTLSRELKFQIVLVTHDKKLQAGKVVEI